MTVSSPTPHQPRVSVCIPTVDRPEMLREAIQSVAAQTWRDFEVVVCDNSGSPDIQRKIDGVLAEFPALSFVLNRQPERVEAADNFNALIDHARGELWACLTDDDRFRPNFLARSVAALDAHPACAFTFADHWVIDANGVPDNEATDHVSAEYGRTSLREGIYLQEEIFELALSQSICLQTTLFRRPTIAALRFLRGDIAGDLAFFLRLSMDGQRANAYYIDERLFEYRVHASQFTGLTSKRILIESLIRAWKIVPEVPRRHQRAINEKLSRCYLALALLEAEEGDGSSARAHARESLRLAPGVRNALGALVVRSAPSAIPRLRKLREMIRQISRSS